MPPLFVNARFLTQPMTGVQRYAAEVARRLKRARPATRFLVPRNVLHTGLADELGAEVTGRLTGHAWEQLELPFYTRGGGLLSLCNTGPLLKRRQVVTLHDAAAFAIPEAYALAFRSWYKVLFVGLGRAARGVLTDSHFSAAELQHYAHVPKHKLRVVYLGKEHLLQTPPDPAVLTRHHLTRPFVLAVSSLSPHKNFGAVVRALEHLGETPFDTVIAGGISPRVHARTAQLPASIKHVGYVSDGELRALYEGASAFIHPALYEGFGLPPLEAMALGCPVIVSKAASLPEVCGDAALYFDPHDPSDLADKIRQLMQDAPLQARLRHEGPVQAARFSWERCADEVLSFAESALAP
ncbi:glycosyltransferase family 4 protein [Truepera radiovictrix]|uniref:Glycosyl transferase group 1 n=1 Tax=Truepera radiovictrix (strain DSM 17093 / CIP 108686 / LMG 22925 / RQ-24) TaxID=649638 RepID=D7CVP7_TRURR|nr:glycosyltransferase family 1 protein [Truepera radiovictrix]ADI15958.1 glycosyl transferase group 1 [Truepera radiovictrix DSM 17093]WMT58416.1 glycosyltransferase family 1 protein [Truepera radiovictrix]